MRTIKPLRRYVPVLERLQIISHIPENSSILDAGTGDGIYLLYLSSKGNVVGLDSHIDRLKRARNLGFPLILGDIQRMPFKDNCFDVLWCSEVIEHLSGFRVFDELERVTRKMTLITIPNPRGPYYSLDKTHLLRYTISSLRDFLSTRQGWEYALKGIGLCLPFKIPSFFAMLFYRLTLNHPSLALNLLIIGKKISEG